jgi:hypothetical protein
MPVVAVADQMAVEVKVARLVVPVVVEMVVAEVSVLVKALLI